MATNLRSMFTSLFGNEKKENEKANKLMIAFFKSLSGYETAYTSYDGAVYEMGLCRAIIHRLASECAKATPTITYGKNEKISKRDKKKLAMISRRPNMYMTAYQFYYRLATIYYAENNAFIIPIYDDYMENIIGLYPVANTNVELKEDEHGVLWAIYSFNGDDKKAIEYNKCGHLRRMQYKNDFFGEDHMAFKNTADLINAQEEGSAKAIKSSSVLRFMARLNTAIDDKADYKEQQELLRFNNLDSNESGVFLYDNRFDEMRTIEGKPLLLDAEQKKAIDNSAYTYWGVNEHFLQCNYSEEEWDAIYESQLESFFIQCGEVITRILFSVDEQMLEGKTALLSSDRLQYASTKTKLALTKDYVDRGIININEARGIINLPPVEHGDKFVIRSEYIEIDQMGIPRVNSEIINDGGKGVNGYVGNEKENDSVPDADTNGK